MITIEYDHGDVSLLAACAAAKQLIQWRPTGTKCMVRSRSEKMTLIMTFTVDANGNCTEETDAIQHEKPALGPVFGGKLQQVGNCELGLTPVVINDSMLGEKINNANRFLFDPLWYKIIDNTICAHPEGRKIDRFVR